MRDALDFWVPAARFLFEDGWRGRRKEVDLWHSSLSPFLCPPKRYRESFIFLALEGKKETISVGQQIRPSYCQALHK